MSSFAALAQQVRAQPRTAAQLIVEALRRAIQSGQLAGGSPLGQEELAAQFGVSRIPVREALKQLESEGLVSSVPHRGAVVASLSQGEIADLFEMMIALEQRALKLAWPLLQAEDFQQAARLLAQLEHESDPLRWSERHIGFHHALYRLDGHPRFEQLVRQLRAQIDRYAYVFLTLGEERDQWQREHRALLAACEAGQLETALAILEAHLQHAAARLLTRLAEQP
jgi:DNA-binding GntR family transcriptional regulator